MHVMELASELSCGRRVLAKRPEVLRSLPPIEDRSSPPTAPTMALVGWGAEGEGGLTQHRRQGWLVVGEEATARRSATLAQSSEVCEP